MAAACSGELSTLAPTINTCPADTDLLLFVNVSGQQGGYAFRPWSVVKQCLLTQALGFGFLQSIVGQTGPIAAGQTVIPISVNNPIADSVTISLDGSVLDRNDGTQISYTVAYSPTGIIVTLNQGASNNTTYIITYAYAT